MLFQGIARNCKVEVFFIHPNTGDDLSDHRDHPLWLGDKLGLDLSIFA